MDWLEQELRSALARREPAPDFAARVLAAAHRRPAQPVRRWMAAAAALLVISSSGGLLWRRHQGMEAKRQVLLALQISAAKLHYVQAHVREVNR